MRGQGAGSGVLGLWHLRQRHLAAVGAMGNHPVTEILGSCGILIYVIYVKHMTYDERLFQWILSMESNHVGLSGQKWWLTVENSVQLCLYHWPDEWGRQQKTAIFLRKMMIATVL